MLKNAMHHVHCANVALLTYLHAWESREMRDGPKVEAVCLVG